jgi:hypothetical protein
MCLILQGFDIDSTLQLLLLGFCALSIVLYSEKDAWW